MLAVKGLRLVVVTQHPSQTQAHPRIQHISTRVADTVELQNGQSIGHVSKMLQFENWNLIEYCLTKNTSNATKKKLQ